MIYWDRIDVSEELKLIKQINQKSAMFVTLGIL